MPSKQLSDECRLLVAPTCEYEYNTGDEEGHYANRIYPPLQSSTENEGIIRSGKANACVQDWDDRASAPELIFARQGLSFSCNYDSFQGSPKHYDVL